MHSTNCVPRPVMWGVFLGALLGSVAIAHAQPAPTPTTQVTIPIGGTQVIQMTGPDNKTHTTIKTVINERDSVARVQAVATDPSIIQVTGLTLGFTRLTLIDVDNFPRVFEVSTSVDLPYLRRVIQQAVPTSSVLPIAASSTSIILTGYVAHAEDVETVIRAAAGVLRSITGASQAGGGAGVGAGAAGGGTVATTPGGVEIINALRVGGVMQVQLDVVVALVNRSEVRRMSFAFEESGARHQFNSNPLGAFNSPATGGSFTGGGNTPLLIPNRIESPNGNPANFFLGLFGNNQSFFGFLQALENDSLAKILSQPRLTTLSGRPAQLVSGGEQPVPQANGLGTTTVEFKPFGTVLEFLPVVMGNGKIYIEVEASNSQLDQGAGININGLAIAGRATQRIRTTVEMEEGQTLALGGLIEHTVQGSLTKVPVLGDLPYFGVLFSTKTFTDSESEVVVMVTPHLVDPMDCGQLPKFLPGQETRKPDDFELFLENILEAPRGPREVYPNGHYKPAWQNGPSANLYPCAGHGHPDSELCGNGGRGVSGCAGCTGGAACGNCTSCGGSRCGDSQPCGTIGTTAVPASLAPVSASVPAVTGSAPTPAPVTPASNLEVTPPSVSAPVTASPTAEAAAGEAKPASLPAVEVSQPVGEGQK